MSKRNDLIEMPVGQIAILVLANKLQLDELPTSRRHEAEREVAKVKAERAKAAAEAEKAEAETKTKTKKAKAEKE